MGFFQGLGRMIAGKPVFETPAGQDKAAPPQSGSTTLQPDASHRFVDEHGYKVVPRIELTHVQSHINGHTMIVTAWATNTSSERVRLDYATIMGQKQTILRELTPGQAHEIKLYSGPVAQNEHNSRAELVFRLIATDDLFDIIYYAQFHRESNGDFFIDELRPDGPTRDI